jgi:hypothetical protein
MREHESGLARQRTALDEPDARAGPSTAKVTERGPERQALVGLATFADSVLASMAW